jgi:hypothetical protein
MRTRFSSPTQHPEGIILLMAVLIIGTVLISAATFANMLLTEIRLSQLVDSSIQSRYHAESGVERALYQLRKREAVTPGECTVLLGGSGCSNDTGYCVGVGNGADVSCITSDSADLSSGSGWDVESGPELAFSANVMRGQSVQVDLFAALQATDPNGDIPSGIGSIAIEWGDVSHATDLYYTLTKLNAISGNQEVEKNIIPQQSCVGEPTCALEFRHVLNVQEDFSYVLRVQALNFLADDAGPVRITAYSGNNLSGDVVPLPGRYLIASSAAVGRSYQQVSVRTPARPPASGLYDFVLFSEEEVVK